MSYRSDQSARRHEYTDKITWIGLYGWLTHLININSSLTIVKYDKSTTTSADSKQGTFFFFKKNLLALPLRDILAFLATPSETIKEVFDLASGLETQTERKQS